MSYEGPINIYHPLLGSGSVGWRIFERRTWLSGGTGGGGNSVVASRVRGGLKKVICQSTVNKGGIIRIILSLMKALDNFIAT